jgi:hypothetical protein
VAFGIARAVPYGRPEGWIGEALTSLGTAAVLGLAATYFDFGGWREADWRAATFAACGALAILGLIRMMRLALRPGRI